MTDMLKKFMESKESKISLKEGLVPSENRSFKELYGEKGISAEDAINESGAASFLKNFIGEETEKVSDEPKIEEAKKESKKDCKIDIDNLSKDELKALLVKIIEKL